MRCSPARWTPALLTCFAGCVYLNGLYNARRDFDRAEALRRRGRTSEARALYDRAVETGSESYLEDPDGRWADDALYLVGRAHLRQGDLFEASAAFQAALAATDNEEVRAGATLYLGAVDVLTGDADAGIRRLNEALRVLPPGELRAEGHLWRARLLLSLGQVDAGWWDLDRAAEAYEPLEVPADLERLVWGIVRSDTARAVGGARGLLRARAGALRADTIHALVERAAQAWGPERAARMLEGVERAPWPAEDRDRALLLRASLHARAGDMAAAAADAGRVTAGVGPMAAEARLWLARLRLADAGDITHLDAVRPLLLPESSDARVLAMLGALRTMELLERRAFQGGRPLALFAAAEMARDELGASRLAANLFLRYAEMAGEEPWRVKALLAARALLGDTPEGVDVLRRAGLERGDPYWAAASGGGDDARFQDNEARLRRELEQLVARARADAAELDAQARARADTARGGPA